MFTSSGRQPARIRLQQEFTAIPVVANLYQKLDNTLSTLLVSTVFGKSDGDPEFVPTAFMVDVCGRIYMAGWGGAVNGSVGNLIGYTTTPDAYQLTTDGSDFYFLVLSEDMQSRIYATFFGGPTSHEHVDGGTSRFDKTGIIYEAVCAGCGGNSDFPYTPGAWSANNNSSNCNEGAAKFEFQLPTRTSSGSGRTQDTGLQSATGKLQQYRIAEYELSMGFW